MRIDFRQGLLRYQTDTAGTPTFLRGSGVDVDLVVSPDPFVCTFADGTEDYSFEERQTIPSAWNGPFINGIDYWLYVDIDPQTGVRSFGSTTLEPVVSFRAPPNPANGQHWFDKNETTQKLRSNNRWIRVIRVFVAKLPAGSTSNIQAFGIGSQAGLWTPTNSGFIVFDENDRPVQRQGPFRQRRFLTTASALASQFTGSAEFQLEALFNTATAVENIPAWSAIALKGPNQVGLASNTQPGAPAIGVVNEDAVPGEVVRVITSGTYTSTLLDFSNGDAGDPLFVGVTGQLVLAPPQQFSIQEIGRVVTPNTMYVDIKQLIKYQG
jgi:hypothetical protein